MEEAVALPGLWSLSPLAALVGVLVVLFLAIANGKLIPSRTHDAIVGFYRQAADDHKASAAEWRSAHAEANAQVRELVQSSGVVADVLRKADLVIAEEVRDARPTP